MKQLFFLLSCLCLSVIGCKKEEKPQPTNSVTILGTWTLTARALDDQGNGNFVDVTQTCAADDTWTFSADSWVLQDLGESVCNPNEWKLYGTSWRLENEETILALRTDFFFDRSKIATLDSHTLVLMNSRNASDPSGAAYEKLTFKR